MILLDKDIIEALNRKPRASGDDPRHSRGLQSRRPVNPARAGMILEIPKSVNDLCRKPRASGDDPGGPARRGEPGG